MLKRSLILSIVSLSCIYDNVMSSSKMGLAEDMVSYLSKNHKSVHKFSVTTIYNNGTLIAVKEGDNHKMVEYLKHTKKVVRKNPINIIDVDNDHDILKIKK